MELAQVFIVYAEWIFFTAWGTALAALAAVAFGRDLVSSAEDKSKRVDSQLPSVQSL
jgi:hypothetical protein